MADRHLTKTNKQHRLDFIKTDRHTKTIQQMSTELSISYSSLYTFMKRNNLIVPRDETKRQRVIDAVFSTNMTSNELAAHLNISQQYINIIKREDLPDPYEMTIAEVAYELNLSEKAVYDIERRALTKMRDYFEKHNINFKTLHEYLPEPPTYSLDIL